MTAKIKSNPLKTVCLLIALQFTSVAFSQSKVIDELAKVNNYTTLYFYPSTIRMLSKILATDQGAAFKEVKKARLVFTWNSDDALSAELSAIAPKFEKEGFESIITIRSHGNNVQGFLKEATIPVYLFSFAGEGGIFILELQGSLSISALQSIATMDPSKAMNLLELKAPEKEEKSAPEAAINTKE